LGFSQSWLVIGAFLALLVSLPALVKWIKARTDLRAGLAVDQARVVSALAVGPHHRVVTVEIGSEGAKTRLVLGVTAQSITCLHVAAVSADSRVNTPDSAA